MTTFQQVVEEWLKVKQTLEPNRPTRRGLLGDGAGAVAVPNRDGYVYVRYDAETSKLAEVFNQRVALIEGMPVVVGTTHEHPTLEQVLCVDWERLLDQWATSYLPPHGASHRVPTGEDPVWVNKEAIVPFSVAATVPASMRVFVNGPDRYFWGHAWYEFTPQLSPNLAGSVPGAGLHRLTLLSIDCATNALQITDGATAAIGIPAAPPACPRGAVPLACADLENGAVAIVQDDIIDMRVLWNACSAARWDANLWIVGDLPGADFPDLDAAVASATSGDTILLAPGNYPMALPIEKHLTFIGLGSGHPGALLTSGHVTLPWVQLGNPIGNTSRCSFIDIFFTGTVVIAADYAGSSFQNCFFRAAAVAALVSAQAVDNIWLTFHECFLENTGAGGAIDVSAAVGVLILRLYNCDIRDQINHGVHAIEIGGSYTLAGNLVGTGARTFRDAPSTHTWWVGDGTGAHFPTIAAAHAHVSVNNNDTLIVYPGSYAGWTMTKNLTVLAMGGSSAWGAAGRVVITGAVTQLDIQAACELVDLCFDDNRILHNTAARVAYTHCRFSHGAQSGAYDVNATFKDCFLEAGTIDFNTATGGWLYVRNCDGDFWIDHGAASLYVDNSDYAWVAGSGQRFTTPDYHKEKTGATNTPVEVMDWGADSTGVPAAGFGVRHKFSAESGSGEGQDQTATDSIWEDAGAGTEDSAIVDHIRIGGAALTEAGRLNEQGILLPAGRDIYPNIYTVAKPGRGLAARLINPYSSLNLWTCHFKCGSAAGAGHLAAYSWDAAAPFGGVPDYLIYSTKDDYLAFTDNAAPWTKLFLRRAVTNAAASWQDKRIVARARVGWLHWGGVRFDDNSDNNYVEFMIDASSIAGGSRVVFRWRDAGGGITTESSAFSVPNFTYYVLYLRCYFSAPNYTAMAYLVSEDGSSINFATHSLMGWTVPPPVAGRAGLLCDPTVAGVAGNPVFFDWFYCDFT